MNGRASLPPDYFERMFAGNNDPWGFETSAYEASKYDATLAALGGRAYESGLEIGCANGVLTHRLAAHCRALLAVDVSASALARATARCAGTPGLTFAQATFPTQRPPGSFDLIVMSEVVYYWSAADIALASAYADAHLRPGGDVLLVHWTGETDYPQSGDDAVRLMRGGMPEYRTVCESRSDKYRLDLWRKP